MALSILEKETNDGLKSGVKKIAEKREFWKKRKQQKGVGHHNVAMHRPLKKWGKIAETDYRVFFCFISREFGIGTKHRISVEAIMIAVSLEKKLYAYFLLRPSILPIVAVQPHERLPHRIRKRCSALLCLDRPAQSDWFIRTNNCIDLSLLYVSACFIHYTNDKL